MHFTDLNPLSLSMRVCVCMCQLLHAVLDAGVRWNIGAFKTKIALRQAVKLHSTCGGCLKTGFRGRCVMCALIFRFKHTTTVSLSFRGCALFPH